MPKSNHKLSLHQLTSLEPVVFCFALSYRSALPTPLFLERRIAELQARLVLLWARLNGQTTGQPVFEALDAPWEPDAIVINGVAEGDLRGLATSALQDFQTTDFDSQPLWSIRRLVVGGVEQSVADEDRVPGDEGFIILCLHHTLADPLGAQRLLSALVSEDISDIDVETWDGMQTDPFLAPSGRNRSPSIRVAIESMEDNIRAKLPFARTHKPNSPRLNHGFDSSPLGEAEIRWRDISPATVSALSSVGETSNLHAQVIAAMQLALWVTFGDGHKLEIDILSTAGEDSVVPGRERSFFYRIPPVTIGQAVKGNDTFKDLTHAASREAGNTKTAPANPHTHTEAPRSETLFLEHAHDKNQFGHSACLSNLGYFQLPTGATDYVWTQTASALSAPLNTCIVGHTNGLRVATSFRTSGPVTSVQVDQIHATFQLVLELAVEGKDSTAQMLAEVVRNRDQLLEKTTTTSVHM